MAGANNRQRLKDIDNTGFGPNSNIEGGRLMNPDGSTNLRKKGIPVWQRISVYHTLLRMKRINFFLFVLFLYTGVNLFFAIIYFATGVEHLVGGDGATDYFHKFMEAFFFSSQTLTTVGYGRVAPSGLLTNTIASIESLIGILIFAVMTGLIYGRFSRPRAYLVFSPSILIAPYKDGKALMVRMATYKNNHLTDVEAQVTVALHVTENDKSVTRFYPLQLEIARINSLALSWTIVHNIDENSPLYHFNKDKVVESRMEVIVNVKAFDDHFSNIVQQRTSYTWQQIIYGAKFLPMFDRAENGEYTILDLARINHHELVSMQHLDVKELESEI
jgi:inward rectifier potassium channel